MARYILGYESNWQEKYDDEAEAIERAEEVATYGHTVEVVRRRFGFHSFVIGFPESEREALKARWRTLPSWFDNSSGSHGDAHHHYNSIGHHGGHGGGFGGGHGHGGAGHGGH
jgi:hypothetical protein